MISLHDFNEVVNDLLPSAMPFAHALLIFETLVHVTPLIRRHRVQLTSARGGGRETAWLSGAKQILFDAFVPLDSMYPAGFEDCAPTAGDRDAFLRNLMQIADFLRLGKEAIPVLRPESPLPLLISNETRCLFCHDHRGIKKPLRRRKDIIDVTLISQDFTQRGAQVVIGYCYTCKAEYHPDRIIRVTRNSKRQFYINESRYLRISKPAKLWVHRSLAVAQAQSVLQHTTFSGWSSWLNKSHGPYGAVHCFVPGVLFDNRPTITEKQSFRMFTEHMVRALGSATQDNRLFHTQQDPNSKVLVKDARDWFVQDGILPNALNHDCENCTHPKRYQLQDPAPLPPGSGRFGVADLDDNPPVLPALDPHPNLGELNDNARPLNRPAHDEDDRVVRSVVMDGKVAGHLLCNAPVDPPCRNSPPDFKSARFCADHADFNDQCGLNSCTQPVVEGSMVCAREAHQQYYAQWQTRFSRQSFHGVVRMLNRREENRQQRPQAEGRPQLPEAPLPPLPQLPDDDPAVQAGQDVRHSFRARRVHCVQILTWACGMPVAATKFFDSESETQCIEFLDRVWPEHRQHLRPDYLAYDRACFLLRYLATHHLDGSWLCSTRFIVDTWHYIGHRVDDVVCRSRCNPAPMDGSQPDLIISMEDENGNNILSRAFNFEAAEQLNAWFDGFKTALNRMTDYNFDFMVFCVLFLLAEDWKWRKGDDERREQRVADQRAARLAAVEDAAEAANEVNA